MQVGEERLILDCGTGIRELGRQLAAAGEPVNATLLLSHSHWDHIQGFPFFVPFFVPGNRFLVVGPHEHTNRLNDTLAGQMQYRYFPIGLEQLSADIRYQEVREETFSVGPAVISTYYLNHTIMAIAYKIQAFGHSVVYCTDTEPFSHQPRAWKSSDDRRFLHRRDEELAQFIHGSDVLIIDSQYTAHEYPSKIGWGHGTPDYGVDLAISAGVSTLVLFHHEPTRIDTAVTVLEQLAQKRAQEEAGDLDVIAAAEGLSLTLADVVTGEQPEIHRALPAFTPRVRIAVVGARDELMRVAWKALAQDHYEVVAMNALNPMSSQDLMDYEPHLVLMEHGFDGWDPSARAFVERATKRHVPILSVVPAGEYELAQDAFNSGASDVLMEPFMPTQLRSRVDSWLMRAGVAVDRRVRGRAAAAPSQAAG